MSISQQTRPVDQLQLQSQVLEDRVSDVRERLRRGMNSGPLASTLTPFDEAGEVDLEGFRFHVENQIAAQPGAIFVGCGTGEFFSLSLAEYRELVSTAVAVVAGRVPVVAGIGYGWAMAVEFAAVASHEGADAGLFMPHYLDSDPPDKIVEQVLEVAARTPLPLILCERGRVPVLGPSTKVLMRVPTLIGIKDCHGDLGHAKWMRSLAPDECLYFNGASGAEVQVRQFAGAGVPAYCSPIHAFVPEVASAFFNAVEDGNDAAADALLTSFFRPYGALVGRRDGYAVSLPKAAARLRGAPMGPVRAPLACPDRDDVRELEAVLRAGLALSGEGA